MSTRTNIIVYFGSTKLYLYRHHDGYLANTGKDLYEELVKAQDRADVFIKALLAKRYEQASYEKEPRSIYEVTTDVHGDIDYLYRVRFRQGSHRDYPVEIGYAVRTSYETELEVNTPQIGQTLEDFKLAVNTAIVERNKRLVDLQQANPGSGYNDYKPEELLK